MNFKFQISNFTVKYTLSKLLNGNEVDLLASFAADPKDYCMRYQRFEDLPVWQSAADLAARLLPWAVHPWFRGKGDLANQLQRSVLSISNNIAEGFERGSTAELLQFIYIARGSAGEARSMLSVIERMEVNDASFRQHIALNVNRSPASFVAGPTASRILTFKVNVIRIRNHNRPIHSDNGEAIFSKPSMQSMSRVASARLSSRANLRWNRCESSF